ncbi:MAG: ABC transporter permease subunit [Acidobacteriota bacterium]
MMARAVYVVAAQEFVVLLRTRWVGGFSVLFLVLVSGFAWFGTANLGIAGIQDFSRTTVSLVNLVCALAPLMALLMGVYGFTIEPGSEELLFSQPVSRVAILVGKALGLCATLCLSTLIGFCAAGAVVSYRVGTAGLGRYLLFIGLTLLLQAAFVSVALLISSFFQHRLRAIAAGLGTWFFFVFLYDLLVIGSTLGLKGRLFQQALFISVFFNPVDLVRVSQLVALNGASFFGPAGAAWVRFCGGDLSLVLLIGGAVLLWTILPAWAGLIAYDRRDM